MRVRWSSERQLMAAIMLQAVIDWRRVQRGEPQPAHVKLARRYGKTAEGELVAFFTGEWYPDLCNLLDLAPCVVREKLGILTPTSSLSGAVPMAMAGPLQGEGVRLLS